MDGLLNRIIVAEPLPLSVHRIDAPSREEALLDESLPVDLVFILFAWKLLSHLEDLDQLSDGKSSSLP